MQPIGAHGGEVVYFRGELGFLNWDDMCMCVVNKQFELLEFAFDSLYVALQYDKISLTFTAGSVCLCGVCSHVIVFGLYVRLSWHPRWMQWFSGCDACTVICVAYVYAKSVMVTTILVWGPWEVWLR